MNQVAFGLILDMIGISILTITTIINPWHGKYNLPFWKKRYYWNGWRPLYKNTKTKKWVLKLNHVPLVFGWIPPKHKLEIIGFVFILVGFWFQLKFYI